MYEYDVEGNYGQGWETIDGGYENAIDARAARKVYDANEPEYPHRMKGYLR